MLKLLGLISSLLFSAGGIAAGQTIDELAWTELGDQGIIIARYLTTQSACPPIIVDGKRETMALRAAPSKEFPVTVCEKRLADTTQNAQINQQGLALPKANPKRIVVIGDTGCRLKYLHTQACNNPEQWPFARIIQQAAGFKPDLVIHVGDYFYRETPCVANKGCAHSVYGDNWQSWREDFFKPAKPLLTRAPWVVARGNHEDCKRGGDGWFRFLDVFHYKRDCHDHTAPYIVPLGAQQLMVMDTSAANDASISKPQVEYFKQDFALLARQTKPTWLISHKPIWTAKILDLRNIKHKQAYLNSLQQASANKFNPNVQLILSGHIHTFQTLNFAGRPAQIIVGNSGTRLEGVYTQPDLAGLKFTNATVKSGINIPEFGYLALEQTEQGWKGQMRDMNGKLLASCQLKQQRFICQHQTPGVSAKVDRVSE